jgi:hypothetical protein
MHLLLMSILQGWWINHNWDYTSTLRLKEEGPHPINFKSYIM